MGFQFTHIEAYSDKPSKRGKKKSSAFSIVKEAERHPDSCPHISEPRPPKLMFGCMPSKALEIALDNASKGTDRKGRKVRKDALKLLAGVCSYPIPTADLHPDDPNLKKWLKLNHKFLLDTFGDNYRSCILHHDEKFIHIHFYIVPPVDENGVFSISSVHPGIRARDTVGGTKISKKNIAYKNAMRRYQDDYYEFVGKPCGLTRIGANRRRLTRSEWRNEQEHAQRLADSMETIKNAESKVAASRDIYARTQKAKQEAQQLADSASKQIEAAKEEQAKLIEMKSKPAGVTSYLSSKVKLLTQQIKSLKEKLNHLVRMNTKLREENAKLEASNRNHVKQNSELRHQNQIRANGLSALNFELKAIRAMIATGRYKELEKYNTTETEYRL